MTVKRTIEITSDSNWNDLRYLTPGDVCDLPTLGKSQTHDLKFENATFRVWYSRMKPRDYDDNRVFNNELIQIEQLVNGNWVLMPGRFERSP